MTALDPASAARPARNTMVNEVAGWLLEWLAARETDDLPVIKTLETLYPGIASGYTIDQAFRLLVRQGAVTRRTGTRMVGKGHAAVRVIATGRVFRTQGCPFQPPEA